MSSNANNNPSPSYAAVTRRHLMTTMKEALEQTSTTARLAEEAVYNEDTRDDLTSWSLDDLRKLTHAVRETFTYLQKEEALFTGKADLFTLDYTAEELTCMLAALRETSRKLAIVLAASLGCCCCCKPMATRHINLQDRDTGESEINMLLKTMKHRAAMTAFTDSKLSELMQLDTLVPVLQQVDTQSSTAPTHTSSEERTHYFNAMHVGGHPLTNTATSVEALTELTQLLDQLQTETLSILETRVTHMNDLAAKKREVQTLRHAAGKLAPLLPQHVLRVGLGQGPQITMDQLVRRPSPHVPSVGIVSSPHLVQLRHVQVGNGRNGNVVTALLPVEDGDVPHDGSWSDADIDRIIGDVRIVYNDGSTGLLSTYSMANCGGIYKSFKAQLESAFRQIVESRAAAVAATKVAAEPSTCIFDLVDYETLEKAHRQVEETRDRLQHHLVNSSQGLRTAVPHPHMMMPSYDDVATPSTPPDPTDHDDIVGDGSDGSFDMLL